MSMHKNVNRDFTLECQVHKVTGENSWGKRLYKCNVIGLTWFLCSGVKCNKVIGKNSWLKTLYINSFVAMREKIFVIIYPISILM